jgi:hypothetical protein
MITRISSGSLFASVGNGPEIGVGEAVSEEGGVVTAVVVGFETEEDKTVSVLRE